MILDTIHNLPDSVTAKHKQAEEQLAAWQQRLVQAQEQVIRWDAIRGVMAELIEEAKAEE